MPYRTGQQKKARLPILDRLCIKTPCDVPWEEMAPGDDTTRYCFRCRKSVYDLSQMAQDDAEAFLASCFEPRGELPCVRLYRRPDGRLLTEECTRGQRLRHLRRVQVGFATATAIAAGLAALGDHVTTPRLAPDDVATWHAADGHLVFDDPDRLGPRIHTMTMGGMTLRDEDDDGL